ncbi:MAG: CCA tRNA nucleotidyltransferase [Candidatus Aenigmatarchaeota archaeon]
MVKDATYKKICNDAIKLIKPSKEEEIKNKKFSELLLKIANEKLKQFNARAMICGSVAKNTNLKGKYETDLFMIFHPSLQKDKLTKFGIEIGKEIVEELRGKWEIAYAEHPYLNARIFFENTVFDVDIVPCYDVPANKIKSAVDRTPHHVKYVIRNLKNPDEARLLKAFMKSAECYGADVKTKGFSGYLCELLIIKYGSFLNCIKNVANWKFGGIILSIEKTEKIKFEKSPLIFIDPVDKNRNVAAAVSSEKLFKFICTARDFLFSPSVNFFLPRKKIPYSVIDLMRTLRARGSRIFVIKFKRPEIINDILYPQMLKCSNRIAKILEENNFKTIMNEIFIDKENCLLLFELENWRVSKIERHYGPSIYDKHAEGFLNRYKEWKIKIKNDKWCVEKLRDFKRVEELFNWLIKLDKEKLLEIGIPAGIVDSFTNSFLYYDNKFFELAKEYSEEFRIFLREIFEEDLNIIV